MALADINPTLFRIGAATGSEFVTKAGGEGTHFEKNNQKTREGSLSLLQ